MRRTTYASGRRGARRLSLCGVIDLHSHVLPGLDDGPADLAGAIDLAQAAERAGTEVLVATPHISSEFAVDPLAVPGRVEALQAELALAGVDVEIATGGELAPERAPELGEPALRAIGLGGAGWVLLECPFVPARDLVELVADRLWATGHRVLLAHPERSPAYLPGPDRLAALVRRGALVQITAGSLRGEFGRTAQRYCWELLDRRLVHVVASDAHDARDRPPDVLATVRSVAAERALPRAMTEWLTGQVPAAVLAGEDPPPGPRTAPAGPPRRTHRRWSFRR